MKMKIMLAVMVLALGCSVVALGQEQQQQQPSSTVEQAPAQKKGLLSKIFGQDSKSKKKSQKTTATTNEQKKSSSAPANRREMMSEEEATIAPYYNNFFATYRLGPEDVISVTVFGHDRYSRTGITIPPHGRISLALIPGGVLVNGKTVEEVAEIIRQKYDEYIIDPKVDVLLDKAVSYRYSVIGDVAQPGIKLMSRRLTVREALAEAGGVLNTGDSSKVAVLRRKADGRLDTIHVNVKAILRGKIPDDTYLAPGDQVVVPGNTLKKVKQIMDLLPVVSFARIFTGGW
jgi:protein involved in polysaccharide export with SLBB domain